jgi:hypothetical protein
MARIIYSALPGTFIWASGFNAMPLIELIREQLEAYARSGRAIHLAHADRALKELQSRVRAGQNFRPVDRAADIPILPRLGWLARYAAHRSRIRRTRHGG